MSQATQIESSKTCVRESEGKNSLTLMFIIQTTCYVGGAVLTATGVIASLCSLFLYHPTTSLFKAETIAIYLLQTIAGFAAVGTAHYLNYHYSHHWSAMGKPGDGSTTDEQKKSPTPT